MTIHATALVDPGAQVDPTADIGPYSIVHADAHIGPDTRIGPHCIVHPGTRLGARNILHGYVSLGDVPQSIGFDARIPSRLDIGDDNTFREYTTVHRSEREAGVTRIGNRGYFMTHSHVGHDCVVDDDVILASGALLAGHVRLHDRVFLSGHCLVHQFCTVGTLAFFSGATGATLDVPPFAVVDGRNLLRGMNVIGLRRAGFSGETRRALHRAYRTLFYSDLNMPQALEAMGDGPHDPMVTHLLDFIRGSERGVLRAHRRDIVMGKSDAGAAAGMGAEADE